MTDILVVDDSNSIRLLLSNTLARAGYSVAGAADGAEGLAEAQNGDYKLIIIDVNMPKMDGMALLQKLRKLQKYAFKPLLMLTTEYSQEMKSAGKAAGATGWIVKPVDSEKLITVVARLLGR